MAYTATNDVNDMDATKPVGTDSPADLDDADRETRTVLKTVIKNAFSSKGAVRHAVLHHVITADLTSGLAASGWLRRPLTEQSDLCSIIGAGDFTNSFKPIAGVYAVEFKVFGYKIDQFMSRLGQATSNSATTEIVNLVGNLAIANNADSTGGLSFGSGVFSTDGTKNYSLEQRHQTNNTTNGWGIASTAAWVAGAAGRSVVAEVRLTLLGTTVP